MEHKQMKINNGDTIILESSTNYFNIKVDKYGCFIYYIEVKKKEFD